MDVDFLAAGAVWETRTLLPPGTLPAIPTLLRASAPASPGLERVLEAYAQIRTLEAAARWRAGRSIEEFDFDGAPGAALAELAEPGSAPERLEAELGETLSAIRSGWDAVIDAGTIRALGAVG